jgi:Tfp pilus assembly protein PilO
MNLQRPAWFRVRITVLHLHYAGVLLLCVTNLVLLTRVVLTWNRVRAGDAAQLQQHEANYRAVMLKTKPLRGLDKKIDIAKLAQSTLYKDRFPQNYSPVAAELGALAAKNNVLLSRVQYAQGKPDEGLYEVRMDASLSGDYAPIVRFINGLERDKIFFVIDSLGLSGQQSGMVNLRMRLTTYLRVEDTAPLKSAAREKP